MKNITKYALALLIVNCSLLIEVNAQVAINEDNANPDASAMLDISSTDKGLLIPRMDSTARKNIVEPANGLLVYDNSTATYWYYDNGKWNEIRNGTAAINYLDFVDSLPDDDLDLSCSTEVEELNLERFMDDSFIAGNFMYAIFESTLDSFYVFDVHDPLTPTFITGIEIANDPSEMLISGQYAYIIHPLTSDNFTVIDISDPLNPIQVSNISAGNRPRAIDIVGDDAYLVDENGDLIVINISDPTSPTIESTVNVTLGFTAKDLVVSNNYAYILNNSNFGREVRVVDISNIANPISTDTLDLGNSPRELKIVGNYAYVIDFTDQELVIIDISDPTNLSIISRLNLGASPRELRIANEYAFVATGNTTGGFKIIDISDPNNPSIESDLSVTAASQSINVFESYTYISGNNLSVVPIIPCDPLYIGVNGFSGALFIANEGDNLGNHSASQNIATNGFYISNDGDDEGLFIDNSGQIGIGTNMPGSAMEVNGTLTASAFSGDGFGLTNLNVTDYSGDISDLQDDVAFNGALIDDLDSRTLDNQFDIADVRMDLSDEVADLDADILDLEEDISNNQSDISALQTDLQQAAPIGTIQMWPTSSPPTGWLICNGASFSSSTYPDLANVLGGTNLPNFSGRFPLGVGNSGTSGSTNHNISSNGGEEKHTLTINEMPSHSHGAGSLKTSQAYLSETGSGDQDKRDGGGTKLYAYDDITGSTASVGGNQSHNNMPPFYTINFIIKAK